MADVIAPFIVEMFNRSLSEDHFPAVFKEAFITPVMKKPGLDAADTSSYRPISNLPVLSKLLERLVVRQLMGICRPLTFYRCYNLDSAVYLRVIGVKMRRQTMAFNQRDQLHGVQDNRTGPSTEP